MTMPQHRAPRSALSTTSGPAAKKLLIAKLRPKLEPHAKKQGLAWEDIEPALFTIESVDDLARVVTTIFGPVPAMEVDAFGKSLANAFRELKSAYVNVLVRDVINCWSKVRLCSTCQSFAAASVVLTVSLYASPHVHAQVSTHDVLKQVLIFFKCADADGSGALDRHELMHMLLTTQKKLANQARLIVDMLAALDENGDGSVSLNEFQASARRQPLVLSSIDSLFQVNRNNMSGVLPSPVSYNGQAKGVAVRCGKDMTGRGRVKRSNRRHRGIVARLTAHVGLGGLVITPNARSISQCLVRCSCTLQILTPGGSLTPGIARFVDDAAPILCPRRTRLVQGAPGHRALHRPRRRPIRGFDDASELRERDETEAAVGVANAPMAL